jgi:hypothetical protein
MDQLELLQFEFRCHRSDPGHVSPWPRQAFHKTQRDRIAHRDENNRDRAGLAKRGLYIRSADADQRIGMQGDQLGSGALVGVGEPPVDREVLALDPAEPPEYRGEHLPRSSVTAAEPTDPRRRGRLLRNGGDRPDGRHKC